jgi:hypothetical protein
VNTAYSILASLAFVFLLLAAALMYLMVKSAL